MPYGPPFLHLREGMQKLWQQSVKGYTICLLAGIPPQVCMNGCFLSQELWKQYVGMQLCSAGQFVENFTPIVRNLQRQLVKIAT